MGRDQDCAVVQIRQRFHQVADLMDAGRVKSVCRLIQNKDRGPAQQRTGEAETLFHSQRIFLCQPVTKFRQAHKVQCVLHSTFRQSQNPTDNIEIFPASQVRIKRRGLNKRADLLQNRNPVSRELLSINGKTAFCGSCQAQQHFHSGGFACSVRAEKTINTAFADMKRNMVDRSEVLIFLRQLFRSDNVIHKNISFH